MISKVYAHMNISIILHKSWYVSIIGLHSVVGCLLYTRLRAVPAKIWGDLMDGNRFFSGTMAYIICLIPEDVVGFKLHFSVGCGITVFPRWWFRPTHYNVYELWENSGYCGTMVHVLRYHPENKDTLNQCFFLSWPTVYDAGTTLKQH